MYTLISNPSINKKFVYCSICLTLISLFFFSFCLIDCLVSIWENIVIILDYVQKLSETVETLIKLNNDFSELVAVKDNQIVNFQNLIQLAKKYCWWL